MARIGVLAVFLGLPGADAGAGNAEDCAQNDDWRRKLAACTVSIDSGVQEGAVLGAAYLHRCHALVEMGESRRAVSDCNRALRIDPENAEAYRLRGIAYQDQGRYRRAVQSYDEALRIDPQLAGAYQGRGFAHKALGEYSNAARDWELAIIAGGAERAKWWQRRLKDNGYFGGETDGVFGPGTRQGLIGCAEDPEC